MINLTPFSLGEGTDIYILGNTRIHEFMAFINLGSGTDTFNLTFLSQQLKID